MDKVTCFHNQLWVDEETEAFKEASSFAQGHQLRKQQSTHSNPGLPPKPGGGGPSTTLGQIFSPDCLSFSINGVMLLWMLLSPSSTV